MSTTISEKRLAANRANAQKSTGPRTPEGKAASSQNAVKHGFRSSSFAVVRLEELDEVAKLKADAVSCYQPANAQELFAVEQIALSQHQMLRAARLEAGLFTDAMNEAVDRYNNPFKPMDEALIGTGDIEICKAQNRNYCAGEGFRRMAKESNVWSLMLRYQAQAERMYRRAIQDFERLKSQRSEMPNEPAELLQVEHPAELVDPHDLNFDIPRKPEKLAPAAAVRDDAMVPPAPAAGTAKNPPDPRPKAA